MRTVPLYVLDAAEQAGLHNREALSFTLASGHEFRLQFEPVTTNGHRPKLTTSARRSAKAAMKAAKRAAKAPVDCPKCSLKFVPGPGLHAHLRATHGLTTSQARKASPLLPRVYPSGKTKAKG
jgi:hypothetical protein